MSRFMVSPNSYCLLQPSVSTPVARYGVSWLQKLDLPKERKADSTSLVVQVTPSMAVTMLDALPYLIDYPYGCTEQTMSRFLPAAITAKTLRDLGIAPEDVMGRVFGGIETNTAAATHPKGKRDLAELDAISKAALERLYDSSTATVVGVGGRMVKAITS